MNRKKLFYIGLLYLLVLSPFALLLGGCHSRYQEGTRDLQAKRAAQAAESLSSTENAEINNIKRRLELTSNPSLVGFILLLNEAGQPIMYTSVKGKVTSPGKRLTQTWRVFHEQDYACGGGAGCDPVQAAPSDEGTWGQSDSYIYFWTMDGQYFQWSGHYLYSEKPFRVRTEPLIMGIQK